VSSSHVLRTSFPANPAVVLILALFLILPACDDTPFITNVEEFASSGTAFLVVTPAAHALSSSGDEVQLSVAVLRADGSPVDDPAVVWETSDASVATVDEDGTVTAHGAGTAIIRASLGRARGDSEIEVLDDQEPPPSTGTREPSGYSMVTDRAFTSLDDAGWGYNSSSRFTIVTDESAPRSCCSVAQAYYPAGFKGGSGPATTWFNFSGRGNTELYASFWLKLSDNWQGHSSGVNKVVFAWIHGDASVYLSAQGSGSGPLRPQIRLQAVPDGSHNLSQNVESIAVERGKWHHWEFQLISNSEGNRNGVARLWIDGKLISDHRDVRYSSSSQRRVWEALYWSPIWGGMGDTVQRDQFMRIDHFYSSGR
jgi:hypothetical protein